jgi:hypothetical protein
VTSDRLNWFLTVAANVGVVLGLGFLAVELRQNTLATQATLHLDLMTYAREHAENQLLVPFEATLFSRCLKPARAKAAVQEAETMLAGWHFGSLPARCRVLSEQEFDSLATSTLPRTAV